MRFRLLDILIFVVAFSFGVAYFAQWYRNPAIQWERFSTDKLPKIAQQGKPALILFIPRLGFFKKEAVKWMNHPVIQRACYNQEVVALDYHFGYAEKIPEGESEEIVWLMAQPTGHKQPFAVISYPNGKTSVVQNLDPEDAIQKLSLRSMGHSYFWISISLFLILAFRCLYSWWLNKNHRFNILRT